MLCAPVRDERLTELKEETNVMPLFRGIMDLLEQMKLDMGNFTIQQVKDVNDYLGGKKKDPLSSSMVEELTKQINSLEDPNQRIRDLLQKRIVDFCKQVISGTMKNMQVNLLLAVNMPHQCAVYEI